MMKIRSILTGIAISLSLAGMAQSQYDGAPETGALTKRAQTM